MSASAATLDLAAFRRN